MLNMLHCLSMNRTTISLEKKLERTLKKIALKERRSFKDVINSLLNLALKNYSENQEKNSELNWHVSSAKAEDFFDASNRSSYMDLISKTITS